MAATQYLRSSITTNGRRTANKSSKQKKIIESAHKFDMTVSFNDVMEFKEATQGATDYLSSVCAF